MEESSQGRRDHGARPLRHWMRRDSGDLTRLLSHARNLDRLQRQLQRRLPDTLAGRWQLAAISGEALTLMAPTPAWAANLRFQQSVILREVCALTGVQPKRCRVLVDPPRHARESSPRQTPTRDTVAQLQEAAASQSDDRLRASLERLAGRLARRHNDHEEEGSNRG